MNLAQLTELYASVLRQLLPYGGYDTAPDTVINADITGHAKALAQAQLDTDRLLTTINGIPPELLKEYERDYGLPLKCTTNAGLTVQQRLDILNAVMAEDNVINKAYVIALFDLFGVQVVDIVTYKPIQCTAPCTSPVNTEQLRYKVTLKLESPVTADMDCIIENYLPAYCRVDYIEV